MAKSSDSKKFSLRSRLKSFGFAFHGLTSLLRDEHNSRIHLIAAILVLIAGILLKIDLFEWILLVIVIGIVFITELLNTAVESLSDRVDPERNEFIRNAKDSCAAAVLISAIVALITGCIIFFPKILALL